MIILIAMLRLYGIEADEDVVRAILGRIGDQADRCLELAHLHRCH